MNKNEQKYYANIDGIAKALDRIANALENNNEEAHNVKHAFTGPNGEQVDKIYYKTRKDMFADNSCTKEEYEAEQAELYTDDIKAQDDALNKETQEEMDIQHDYLHGLVQDLDNERYNEFCNIHCLPASDAVAVSNYIADLDFDECLGIINEIEAANADDLLIHKSDDQANEDAIEFEDGVTYDDDYDLRVTAKMYITELKTGDFRTKKECILDYVTNEFSNIGARYTDIIKFAFYLNHPNGPKFDSTRDRGYYSLGMSGRNPYLTRGGNDFLVKGINNEGIERYFTLSHVDNATGFWKYI